MYERNLKTRSNKLRLTGTKVAMITTKDISVSALKETSEVKSFVPY